MFSRVTKMKRARQTSFVFIVGLTIISRAMSESVSLEKRQKDELNANSDLTEEPMGKRQRYTILDGDFDGIERMVMPRIGKRQAFDFDEINKLVMPRMDRRGDDFFLKASKSVPRIGRRGDDFFIKASKNVPRVGRRNSEFLKASKAIPRIGKKNNDPFLIGVKSVPRIGRSDPAKELGTPMQKRQDSFLAVNDGGLWGVWPWFRNPDLSSSMASKRSSYILSSYNDLPQRDKQAIWNPTAAFAQEVELGPPIHLKEQI